MSRLIILVLAFSGCAKTPDLPDAVVRAGSTGEMADFRAELGNHFAAEQLRPLDTALDELKLDAMNRGVSTAVDREQDMLTAVNGKTVRDVLVLGWHARKARFLREIAELTKLLDHDLQQQEKTAGTGTPESVTHRIESEREVLDQLHHNLAETERRLAGWSRPGS